mgnify:CR=1 FL=1
MDKKVTGIIAYLTLIGWLIAYLAGDKEGAKFHLNQALVLAICNIANVIIGMIPIIGGFLSSIISIIILIFAILGIVYAAQDQEKELPLIGTIKILK